MSKIYKRQKQSREDLDAIWERPDFTNIIHYSCESFYDRPEGTSPRITSIAVRNLHTAQTKSFSIHKFGELKGIKPCDLNAHYDDLEREMIEEFLNFAKECKDFKWVHWNMRDENYGFHAIELRFKVLGGKVPFQIPDEKKFDLSRILIGIYGSGYIGHPRFENIMKKNHIKNLGFKTGKEEAELFEQGNYVALHQSTLAKCDILSSICQKAYEGKLLTLSKWWEVHGSSVSAFMAFVSNHSGILFFMFILSFIANIIQIIQAFKG